MNNSEMKRASYFSILSINTSLLPAEIFVVFPKLAVPQ